MTLLISHRDRILYLTLNRPAKRNALNLELCTSLVDAVGRAQGDPSVACIVISAAGSVFCAGMDLDEAGTAGDTQLATVHEQLFSLGARSVKPILAAVQGPALGGGLGLVTQSHVAFAAEGATFGLPEIKVGLWPFLVYRSVSAAIGPRRALAISLSGRPFDAEQARDWGLLHRILPPNELEDRIRSIARRLAHASPLALSLGMQYVRDAAGKSWDESGQLAARFRSQLMGSEDFAEGRRAFKEKREAHWPSMPPGFYDAS